MLKSNYCKSKLLKIRSLKNILLIRKIAFKKRENNIKYVRLINLIFCFLPNIYTYYFKIYLLIFC